jgi:hypothetical protein
MALKPYKRTSKSVRSIGYLDRAATLQAIDTEERMATVLGRLRTDDLLCVKRFVEFYHQGDFLNVTLRRRQIKGTLLGYRKNGHRGWVMGVLESGKGTVKDITIDPSGYELMIDPEDGKPVIDCMVEYESKYICLATDFDTILQISPMKTLV